MKKIFILIFTFTFIFCGCAEKVPEEPAIFTEAVKNEPIVDIHEKETKTKESDFCYGITYSYEDMDKYSNMESVFLNSKFFADIMDISSEFPSKFVIKCYIEKKTPIISLNYTSNTADMIKFSKNCLNASTQVYYDIFPCYGNEDKNEYKKNFKNMYSLIKKYAPDSKIIWSVNALSNNSLEDFFPGENYVDYIGLMCLFESPYDNIEEISNFKSCHQTYSDIKPIIITKFAVNYFDKNKHTYMIDGAEKFIEYFYKELCPYIPNISAVIYYNQNNSKSQNTNIKPYDYSVNSILELKNTLSDIIS